MIKNSIIVFILFGISLSHAITCKGAFTSLMLTENKIRNLSVEQIQNLPSDLVLNKERYSALKDNPNFQQLMITKFISSLKEEKLSNLPKNKQDEYIQLMDIQATQKGLSFNRINIANLHINGAVDSHTGTIQADSIILSDIKIERAFLSFEELLDIDEHTF